MSSILVVDDNPRVLDALARLLESFGHTVVPVEHGPSALEAIGSVEFILAMVDLRLPGMTGVGLMRRLRDLKPDMPIIAFSGMGTMEDLIQVLRAGASDYLKKPIRSDDLKAALERAFRAPAQSKPVVAAVEEPPPPSSEELLQEALEELAEGGEVPPSPDLLPAIQSLMEDLTCGVDPILEVVGRDPAVAGEVLRTAKASHKIKEGSLRDVTLKLGNRRVLATAHEVVLRNSLGAGEGPLAGVGKKLWANVQVTARGAQELASLMGLPDPDGFYVDGLLHNVGESVMLRTFNRHLHAEAVRELTMKRLAKEVAAAHEPLGRRVLEAWGMPDRVVRTAGFHHREDPIPMDTMAKVRRHLVLAAWGLAIRAGFEYLPGPAPDADEHLRLLQLDTDKVRFLFSEARSWVNASAP